MKLKLTPLGLKLIKGLFSLIAVGLAGALVYFLFLYFKGTEMRLDAIESRPAMIVKEVRVITATPSAAVKPVFKVQPSISK